MCALVCGLSAFPHIALAQGSQKNPSNADWQTYELGRGSFSVLLPGKPVEGVQNTKNADVFVYTLRTEGGFFVSSYSLLNETAEKWPKDRSEPFYQGVWEGMAEGFDEEFKQAGSSQRVKLSGQRKVTFAGHDGAEFIFLMGERQGRFVITRVGRRAFSAMVLGIEGLSPEDQERFLSSFKISNPPPEPKNPGNTNRLSNLNIFRMRT
jgi:hypothetical protein